MPLVIVESPAKSKTIVKYLGSGYTVLASFGHLRDLPSKDGSVRPDEDFAMTYEVEADKAKRLAEIVKEARITDKLILATDPDREGEAISWHVLEALKEKKALKAGVPVERVVFNEITKKAVLHGVNNPRQLDMNLVNAQQARRALDYLVGFTLSPLLWRKLPGAKSAGRVQSVALRLICEREAEIEKFKSEEYWTIEADLTTVRGDAFTAKLAVLKGGKVEKFSFRTEAEAKAAVEHLQTQAFTVASLNPKQIRRNPPPPFTTSTLQQEAARKLGFTAKRTMQIAQKLYEGVTLDGETTGLITYMRTDGVYVSQDALEDTRRVIAKMHGDDYVPEKPRFYQAKAKNAQEAHEAIRPTAVWRTPEMVARFLDDDQKKLYTLIWKRMVASQMAQAVVDQLTAELVSGAKDTLRAVGSVIQFPGFLALYSEGKDDEEDEESRLLPVMKEGEKADLRKVKPDQHFTEPLPRYSEASLVKKLEELGIGRPSTYASILSVLQEREYVRLDKKRFVPEARGRIVTAFLEQYFPKYVEYGFTAGLEEELDEVSDGKRDWKALLRRFWDDFSATNEQAKPLPPAEIIQAIETVLADYIYPPVTGGADPRQCPACAAGKLGLKAGKFGAFLGCSNYPECNFTRQLGGSAVEGNDQPLDSAYPKTLGNDTDGIPVSLRKGPYGVYVQRDEKVDKPKRAGLPKGVVPEQVTLEQAIALLALPREIGTHPETGKPVRAGIGRFGPYVEHDRVFVSLKADDDVLSVGMNRAIALLADKAAGGGRGSAAPLKVLGAHPDGGDIGLYSGKYGPYVKWGKVIASLPKGVEAEGYGMEAALELINAKAGAGKSGKGKAKAAPKAKAASKTAAKPKAAAVKTKIGARPKTATKKPVAKRKASS